MDDTAKRTINSKNLSKLIGAPIVVFVEMKKMKIAPPIDFKQDGAHLWYRTPELQVWVDAIIAHRAAGNSWFSYPIYTPLSPKS